MSGMSGMSGMGWNAWIGCAMVSNHQLERGRESGEQEIEEVSKYLPKYQSEIHFTVQVICMCIY